MNADGDLIGLAFDGNWEAMSGDIAFEHQLQRTISVDIRYVMWILDKYAGCTNLIEEMDFVYASDEPADVLAEPQLSEPTDGKCFACEARERQRNPDSGSGLVGVFL